MDPVHRPGKARRCASAAALVLALAACTTAEAAAPATPPGYEPHPAVAIVDRIAGSADAGLPDLEGLTADEAVAALLEHGLHAQVVAYDEGPVSAQYPEPGGALPQDGRVVVWTGVPPAPPPPAPPVTAQESPDVAEPEPAPDPEPDREPDSTPSPAPADAEKPPPARTSPRRMDATEPGVVLEGLASWYGPGFAGRTTACGGTFDPGAKTLATRELRCGTRVQVTGPGGRTVEAVVTDWGPAEWTGRRFDLSRATFAAVHSLGAGVAQVTVEVLR